MSDYKERETYDAGDSGYSEGAEYDEYEEDDEGITAEDCWTVVSAFFDSKGLVSQQLDSFDEFVSTTMQDMVSENGKLVLDQNAPPDGPDGEPIALRRYEINFGTVSLAKPMQTEGDGSTDFLLPQEARLRNLTYSAPLYLEMTKKVTVAREKEEELDEDMELDPNRERNTYLQWDPETDENQEPTTVFIGRLPVMLKSEYCNLKNCNESGLYAYNECPYDQGGYFIINGSEKVLIAQERSAANIVQVFKKPLPSPTPYVA
jgi:DNA-directed RNA polymerase II subunit RPB2